MAEGEEALCQELPSSHGMAEDPSWEGVAVGNQVAGLVAVRTRMTYCLAVVPAELCTPALTMRTLG